MDEIVSVPFSLTVPDNTELLSKKLIVNNTDSNVAIVDLPEVYFDGNEQTRWNSTINITGIFIGKARIKLILPTDEVFTQILPLLCIRLDRG